MILVAAFLIVGVPALCLFWFVRGAKRLSGEREWNRKLYEYERSKRWVD